MCFSFNTKALRQSPKSETLLQTYVYKANITVLKVIQWDQISLLDKWEIDEATKF